MMKTRRYEYDVALSFAGENRIYVEEVANELKNLGINVFYDVFEEANLWGKNLYEYLCDVYQNKARYTVLFISKFYNKKLWTNHERVSMQARAFQESYEYILPARFDNTEIPGILRTIGYINLQHKSSKELAMLLEKKINKDRRMLNESVGLKRNARRTKPFLFSINVSSKKGSPIRNAKVLMIAKNNTYLEGLTDENGSAYIMIQTQKTYTLLIAHNFYVGEFHRNINPNEDFDLILERKASSGSIIFNRSLEIPGISGKIEPILYKNKKLRLYADNMAIENNTEQPYSFEIDTPITIEDNQGKTIQLLFKFLQGNIGLVNFKKMKN